MKCKHHWAYFGMIYPGNRVEMWWSCSKCKEKKEFKSLPDTPETRRLVLTSRKAHSE